MERTLLVLKKQNWKIEPWNIVKNEDYIQSWVKSEEIVKSSASLQGRAHSSSGEKRSRMDKHE